MVCASRSILALNRPSPIVEIEPGPPTSWYPLRKALTCPSPSPAAPPTRATKGRRTARMVSAKLFIDSSFFDEPGRTIPKHQAAKDRVNLSSQVLLSSLELRVTPLPTCRLSENGPRFRLRGLHARRRGGRRVSPARGAPVSPHSGRQPCRRRKACRCPGPPALAVSAPSHGALRCERHPYRGERHPSDETPTSRNDHRSSGCACCDRCAA